MVLYDYAREGFLDGTLDADADTIVAKALGPGYIPSASTHQFLDDIDPADIIASGSAALSGKAVTDGVFTSSNVTVSAVGAGDTIVGFALVDTTVDGANGGRLICYVGKDSNGVRFNIETTGDDVVYRPGGATGRWFSI
jgi:hypothetical protein